MGSQVHGEHKLRSLFQQHVVFDVTRTPSTMKMWFSLCLGGASLGPDPAVSLKVLESHMQYPSASCCATPEGIQLHRKHVFSSPAHLASQGLVDRATGIRGLHSATFHSFSLKGNASLSQKGSTLDIAAPRAPGEALRSIHAKMSFSVTPLHARPGAMLMQMFRLRLMPPTDENR